jgi:hypothetical protein
MVTPLLAYPGRAVLVPMQRHAGVAEQSFWSYRISLVICYMTLILMRERGIRQICTRDTDLSIRVFGIR